MYVLEKKRKSYSIYEVIMVAGLDQVKVIMEVITQDMVKVEKDIMEVITEVIPVMEKDTITVTTVIPDMVEKVMKDTITTVTLDMGEKTMITAPIPDMVEKVMQIHPRSSPVLTLEQIPSHMHDGSLPKVYGPLSPPFPPRIPVIPLEIFL